MLLFIIVLHYGKRFRAPWIFFNLTTRYQQEEQPMLAYRFLCQHIYFVLCFEIEVQSFMFHLKVFGNSV